MPCGKLTYFGDFKVNKLIKDFGIFSVSSHIRSTRDWYKDFTKMADSKVAKGLL